MVGVGEPKRVPGFSCASGIVDLSMFGVLFRSVFSDSAKQNTLAPTSLAPFVSRHLWDCLLCYHHDFGSNNHSLEGTCTLDSLYNNTLRFLTHQRCERYAELLYAHSYLTFVFLLY